MAGLAKLKLEMEIVGDRIVVKGLDNVERAVDRTGATTKTSTGQMAADLDSATAASSRLTTGFGLLAAAGAAAFAAAGKYSISYLSQIETASLGIAAAYVSSGKYIDATTGKTLQGAAALQSAQADTARTMEQLKVANMQTIATLDQLVRAYQETLPVAIAEGFNRDQVMAFTQAMVQAAGAIGLSLDQMGEETRSILTGNINPRNSRIATVLGLRNEDLAQFKGNATALFDFLMTKLDAYRVAGVEAQTTWEGLTSNIKDLAGQAGGMAFDGLFETAKYELQELTKSIVTIDEKTKTISWNPAFVEDITSVKLGINSITAEIYRVSMLLDLAGGSMTAFGSRALKVAEVFTRFMTIGQFGNSLKGGSEQLAAWNKMYEQRYQAAERALQALAMRESGLDADGNPLKNPGGNSLYQPNSQDAAREAAAAKRKAAQDAEEKRAQAAITWWNKEQDAIAAANPYLSEHESKLLKLNQEYENHLATLVKTDASYEEQRIDALKVLDAKQRLLVEQEAYNEAIAINKKELADYAAAAEATAKLEQANTADNIKAAADASEASRLAVQNKLSEIDVQEKFYQLTAGQAAEKRISLLEKTLALEAASYKAAGNDKLLQEQLLAKINSTNAALLEQKKIMADATAWGAAKSALQDYARAAADIGAQTKGIVTDFAKGMEDALTEFVRTGKLSFKDLIDDMLNQIARMAVQQGITGPLSSMFSGMLGSLMNPGTAAAAGPTIANAAGLLGGTSAGGLSTLLDGMKTAVGIGAKTGTTAGASAGVTAGLASMAPMLGLMVGGYLTNSYFGSGGLMGQSTDAQKAMRGTAFGVGVGGGALIGGAAAANAGMMGTSAAALAMAGSASWIPIVGQVIVGLTALSVGLDAITGGGLFGTAWKTTASGLSLGVEGGDFAGQTYYTQKKKKALWGGSKSRTRYGELDPLLADFLESQYGNITTAIGSGSAFLGGSGDLSGFSSAAVKLNMKGKDAEAQQKALEDYFRTISDQAITSLYANIGDYAKLGEDTTATFQRLTSSAATVNELFSTLGLTLNEVSLAGAAASDSLVEALGGLQQAQATISSYYSSGLFSESEQQMMELAAAQRQVNEQFSSLGLAVPKTNLEFRDTVNHYLSLGEAGAKTAAGLIGVADAFGTLTDFARTAADAMQAIQGGNLSILSPSDQYLTARDAFQSASDADAAALASDFLSRSRDYNATGETYIADYNLVMTRLADIAAGAVTPGTSYILPGQDNAAIIANLQQQVSETQTQTRTILAGFQQLLEVNQSMDSRLQSIEASTDLQVAA